MSKIVEIYTDGSSRGNPGPGGWGAIIINENSKVKELGGREDKTTNNRMELTAALEGLKHTEKSMKGLDKIILYTDSEYLQKGVMGWMYSWEKNGWKTSAKEEVLNQDIWKEILAIVYRIKLKTELVLEKVKGHSGHIYNDRADLIATEYADNNKVLLFAGARSDYEKLFS